MNLRKAAEMALEIIEGKWPADDEIASRAGRRPVAVEAPVMQQGERK